MKKKGISLITLVITIIVVMILAAAILISITKNNPVKQADLAVLKQNVAVMQDVLNLQISDITLECMEPPVFYMDEDYSEVVTDRVCINQDHHKIGKLYYTTSTEKGCIIFGKEGQAKESQVHQVATNGEVGIEQMKYRYTDQELPTYKNKTLKWYVTHTNRIVLEIGDMIVAPDNGEQMNQPGTYTMTVNAGTIVKWLGIDVNGLVVPEGARVEYFFETSDDRIDYEEAVNQIENTKNSQYLRVKIKLIPNSKGECPSLVHVKVRFQIDDEIKVEEPVLENMVETNEIGQTVYELEEGKEEGKISQIIDFGENYDKTHTENTTIEIPIIKDHKTEYLSKDKNHTEGANVNFYVSDDGQNWIQIDPSIEDTTGHRYVKVETVVTDPNIKVGEVQVNAAQKEAEQEFDWITYKTEYYDCDAGGIGHWIACETEQETPSGTRIKYTFSKSNDEKKWSKYSEEITENGDSRYIRVKVEYQKRNKNITNEATLNDIILHYIVDGKEYTKTIMERELNIELIQTDTGVWKIVATDPQKKIAAIEYYKSGETESKRINQSEVEITENATYLVKVIYEDGSESEEKEIVVDQIPDVKITVNYSTLYYTQDKITLTITGQGVSGVKELKYVEGKQSAEYVAKKGISLLTQNTIEVEQNTTFTFYLKDGAGNERVKVENVYNIMPELEYKGILRTEKGLVEYIKETDLADGKYDLTVEGVVNGILQEQVYYIEIYNYQQEVEYTSDGIIGDDIPDERTVIVKYHQNMTVGEACTIIPRVRKRGMYLCTMGNLENHGTISMVARGAIAEGQDVYLYRNHNQTYEYIPAIGGTGGAGRYASSGVTYNGRVGAAGTNRALGGGGSGQCNYGTSGSGGSATSYSGGTGGGAAGYDNAKATAGSSTGGKGGVGRQSRTTASGGTGNPGGGPNSNSGTGGLLILYTNHLNNSGSIIATGTTGGKTWPHGGASGGGSINIFYNGSVQKRGNINANGGRSSGGGHGGNGSISIGSILTGDYEEYNE